MKVTRTEKFRHYELENMLHNFSLQLLVLIVKTPQNSLWIRKLNIKYTMTTNWKDKSSIQLPDFILSHPKAKNVLTTQHTSELASYFEQKPTINVIPILCWTMPIKTAIYTIIQSLSKAFRILIIILNMTVVNSHMYSAFRQLIIYYCFW